MAYVASHVTHIAWVPNFACPWLEHLGDAFLQDGFRDIIIWYQEASGLWYLFDRALVF